MMIFLFSQSRAVLIALEALTLLFVMTRIYDGASAVGALLVFLAGSIIAVLAASFYAGLLHHRLLLVLYALERPKDFIRVYEPLLSCKWVPANVRFTLNAYLSNGHAAMGDFSRARQLLDRAPQAGKRQAFNRELILCANRTSIALSEGAAEEAKAQLLCMEELIRSPKMSAKNRDAHRVILKGQNAQLRILRGEGSIEDCDTLRSESKKPGSALRKTELNYFIGRGYAQLNQPAFAREYLSAAAKSKEIHLGVLAAHALAALGPDPEKK